MVQIKLSTLLGDRRWTQADIARMTGIRVGTINAYYHNVATNIKREHIDLLCEALQCDVKDLIVYSPNDTPSVTKDRRGMPINPK